MSEEEAIKEIEDYLDYEGSVSIQAIATLYTSYQKEKKKNKKVIDYIEKNKEKFKNLDYAYPEAVINHFNKINNILKGE